jgi:hypothetical protein
VFCSSSLAPSSSLRARDAADPDRCEKPEALECGDRSCDDAALLRLALELRCDDTRGALERVGASDAAAEDGVAVDSASVTSVVACDRCELCCDSLLRRLLLASDDGDDEPPLERRPALLRDACVRVERPSSLALAPDAVRAVTVPLKVLSPPSPVSSDASDRVTSEGVTSDRVTSDRVTSDRATSDRVTSDRLERLRDPVDLDPLDVVVPVASLATETVSDAPVF